MPISIPTSIAGISVPGTINGPLQLLYGNKYKFGTHRYPRNLGTDPTRSHVIRFTSMQPDPKYQSQIATNITNIGTGIIQGGLQNIANGVFSQSVVNSTKDLLNDVSASDIPRVPFETISLYIPDTVNVSYSASYDDISLTESLGKAYFLAQAGTSMFDMFKGAGDKSFEQLANKAGSDPFIRRFIANAIGDRIGASNLGDLALRGVGQAMNPQLQVLFRGVGFRSFQFDFVFTPYSKEETETVNKIIKSFKYASAPEINPNGYFSQGVFMKVPFPFKIDFLYKGKENPYVHKIGETVLENVNVDYGPNGWSTFNDGSPVQIRLTLQFKETVIVDKNKINAGY